MPTASDTGGAASVSPQTQTKPGSRKGSPVTTPLLSGVPGRSDTKSPTGNGKKSASPPAEETALPGPSVLLRKLSVKLQGESGSEATGQLCCGCCLLLLVAIVAVVFAGDTAPVMAVFGLIPGLSSTDLQYSAKEGFVGFCARSPRTAPRAPPRLPPRLLTRSRVRSCALLV